MPIIDSREAVPGSLFFAFEGERVDGHAYVGDAFARGATAAVVAHDVQAGDCALLDLTQVGDEEEPRLTLSPAGASLPLLIRVPDVLAALQEAARWWRLRLDVRVIGITGSVGKTTTKEIVARVLGCRYRVTKSQGSYNNEIGLPLTLLGLTSESERVVLEMGMYVPGDIRFLSGIAHPDVGIITNVEPVHAERAGTIEAIALGKRELVEALPPAPEGVAILNYDDGRVREMSEHTQARCFFYGLSPQADLWADGVESLGMDGIRARLHFGGETVPIEVPMLGRHSIFPVLRGAAIGLVEGMDWDEIVSGLQTPSEQLRLVTVPGPDGSMIIDDTYNSSPPSALAALTLLDDLADSSRPMETAARRRKVAVLGDMLELGDYEREGHLEVGCHAAGIVSELVVVGGAAETIGEGAAECGLAPAHIHPASDSEAAIEVVRSLLLPGDLVLIKGSRGVKMEHIVAALTDERHG